MYIIAILFLIFVIIFEIIIWRKYRSYDGEIVVTTNSTGKTRFSLELNRSPEVLKNMKRISFKVVLLDDPSDNVVNLEYTNDAD